MDHAHNLAAVFNDSGIPVAVLLGDTNREDRDKAIAGFRNGSVKVLVNVIVATEGFDLPDASCIIIARPTMSLALYLQMVGRGLRPKDDGGDCLILDLAANSVTHGLPEDYREWTLEPRGAQKSGEAPIVVCPLCETASPAASHNCRVCGYAFGKDCDRCGRWRAHKRWYYQTHCGNAHQQVCDLCHIDAHIQAHLPVAPPLDELVDQYDPEDDMTLPSDVEIGDDLANRMSALLAELLESERQSIAGADDVRREELRGLIEDREAVLSDDNELDKLFSQHIATLPYSPSRVQERRIFGEWEDNLNAELLVWRADLLLLEDQSVDKQGIYDSARSKMIYLLRRAAENAELLPDLLRLTRILDSSLGEQTTPNNADQANQISGGAPRRFYIVSNRHGISAECDVYSENRIVVLAGSTATKRENKGHPHYESQKERLIADGVLVDDGQRYKFAADHEVTSPSAAGAIVLATPVNGRQNLKDAGGIPFAQYYPR